ncbi:zinc transporter [Sphingomonas guangdongensis]|uniref:Zinc transporter n=1 Tax=Sphingomonas guangdongensis TaxID=1141890 RepID=A0A285QJ85_9SPHN|nr:CorA family divalent cation transporter [Sphingomonas guangdongensis]SOB80132.1 zinc transporter [Sphingomonas guangdongensis]
MSGFAFVVTGKQVEEVDHDAALTREAELVWVHLNVTNEEAQHWLDEVAHLPDYVIEGLTAAETRPRCTAMDDGALINMRGLSDGSVGSDLLASVRLFARKGRVISVTRFPLKALEAVRAEVGKGKVADPGDLIAAFATAITAGLDPVVAKLGDELDDCESELDARKAFDLRRGVNRVRFEAIAYRRFLFPQRVAIEELAGLDADWLEADDRLHLSAAADRAARMAEEVESIRERAGLMHETLTDLRSELIDQRSLVIAIAAMVFLPLTFLTGLYGMNVEGLWFAHEPWAFDAIVGLCVLIAASVAGYFIRRHWTR